MAGARCTTDIACGNVLSNGSHRSGSAHVPVDWKRARAIPLFSPWLLLHFFLAGDRATKGGEGCSGLERPLICFKLEKNTWRNLILLSIRLGVDIISRFLNVQHCKVARVTQTFFSCGSQLCSYHKCFSVVHHVKIQVHWTWADGNSLQRKAYPIKLSD